MAQKSENVENVEDDYDGFYFLPVEDEKQANEIGMNLAFFKFKDEMADGIPIESSDMGDKYHIVFFKPDEEGYPKFDESFEAILSDPVVYINNLYGSLIYGCVLRKTNKSEEWFEQYLDHATNGEFRKKLIGQLKSISS
jgi:hypothetical protein